MIFFRKTRIRWRQATAVKGLSEEQKRLLQNLWEVSRDVLIYQDAVDGHYYDCTMPLTLATQRMEHLVRECLESGIDRGRVDAFLVTTYD